MAKISSKVSGGLADAIKEAQAKMEKTTSAIEGFPGENTVESLLNAGAENQKKRKRRTKAEMEAAKNSENQGDDSLFESLGLPKEEKEDVEDNRPEWEKRHAIDHDEFCKWELEKAKLKGLPEPDFDFRNYYEKGQIVYFVRILASLGEKEVKKLSLRTIYPRMMVGSEEKAACQCIGYNERDKIFLTPRDADAYAKTIQVSARFASEEPKSGRKRSNSTDEEVEDEEGLNEAYTSSEEED